MSEPQFLVASSCLRDNAEELLWRLKAVLLNLGVGFLLPDAGALLPVAAAGPLTWGLSSGVGATSGAG